MPLQLSPPARQTRSQAVLTLTPRAPFDGTPAVLPLNDQLDRGPNKEGAAPSRKEGRVPKRSNSFSGVVGGFPGVSRTSFRGPGEDGEEEEENSVEEGDSDGTEAPPAPVGASEGTRGPTLAQSDQPISHQTEPSLLAIMQKMTQIMANLQSATSSEVSRPTAFKTSSMKAPECFDGTQPFNSEKVLYATSFLVGRAANWIEPYLSNLTNQDSSYLLHSWPLFESQLFTLFGDPNEVSKAEAELDVLRMKEGGNVALYIAYFRSLLSIIGDWGQRPLIHHLRKGFASRLLDQLASHCSNIDSLQDLMDVSLKLDTRYHERQKEKNHHQEKKPEASKSNSSHHQNSSSSSHKKKNFHSQRRDKPHSSLLNKDFKLKGSEKERRIKEGLWKSLTEDHVVFNGLHCFPSRAQLCILNTGVSNSLKLFVFSSLSDVFHSILIDSGATNSFIAKQFVDKYSLTTSELPEKILLIILDSSESPSLFVTHHTKYMVKLPPFPSFEWDFLVIDTPKGEDLILGFDFLNHFKPSIDWRHRLITFTSYYKDYSDPFKSFHNDFSSAKSCAALVGDSRTTSFLSSVHIPSINSPHLLLLYGDEVFKEIQDVGEDNSLSSLHLFLGIWTFLAHLIMTPWRSCVRKRKSQKQYKP
ncbi:hypothetical protein O181_089266 [Austropuccinia psidii MF-1]|uniref:Retrotransposon gag domain-containing protein n=1 Tax=Austropuccinia psidii MF-1 TaxID=1389203 RepID=A0A9Q3IT56_9BASI|nr:hypothetical protein [Austropuccinia psidii MF-1]